MSSVSKQVREERLAREVDADKLVSTRTYNLVIGAVVLYGIVANIILCYFAPQILLYINPLFMIFGYIVFIIIGSIMAHKSSNPFVSFIGYNFICVPLGLCVAMAVQAYGGIGAKNVQMVFFYTLIITAIMVIASILVPQFFDKIGKVLVVALIAVFICGLFVIFFQGLSYVYSLVVAVLFSLYIGYDVYRSQKFPKTLDNAVDSAIDIYLDMVNLFLSLLRIFGRD